MTTVIQYLAESVLCATAVAVLYFGLFRWWSSPGFNRWYLLFGALFSAVVPFLRTDITAGNADTVYAVLLLDEVVISSVASYHTVVDNSLVPFLSRFATLNYLYFFGFVVLFVRFLWSLKLFSVLARTGVIERYEGFRLKIVDQLFKPFSFIRTIYIDKATRESNMFRVIVKHEAVHIRQRHSIDILLYEPLLIIQWFNPMVWLLRHAIRENHEFLADRGVISSGISRPEYCKALLYTAMGATFELGNNFSYSLTNKRFKKMKKHSSVKNTMVSVLIAGALFWSSFTIVTGNVIANEVQSITVQNITPPPPPPPLAPPPPPPVQPEDKIYEACETAPEYPGGEKALLDYLGKSVRYPEVARDQGITGSVLVTFVVDKTGRVTNAHVKNKVDTLLAAEALRVVNSMPSWIPGKNHGRLVNVRFTLPINFALEKSANAHKSIAQFPGGMAELMKFMRQNVKYPKNALEKGIGGKVFVKFVVAETGKVQDVAIERGVDSLLDAEALRVVSIMPKWVAAQENGQSISSTMTLPVMFALDNGKSGGEAVFMVVEEMPKFVGGNEELSRFMRSNLKYPEQAKKEKLEGMVYISFVVTSTGSISDVSVARGVCTLLDAEAVRVVKSMPNWIPGKQRGKAVSVSYMLPIKFELTDKGEGVSAEKPLVSEDVMKIIHLKYTNSTTGKEISGQLVDSQQKPIQGVSIISLSTDAKKGYNKGTMSDKSGNFKMLLDKNSDAVVFSFIGKKTIKLVVPATE